jgi:DNA repair protein RadC
MNKVAEIQIIYKSKVKACNRVLVKKAQDAEPLFRTYYKDIMEYREAMYVMYINRGNFAIGIKLLSYGGTSGTVCDAKLIMQGALKVNAHAFILCHNHPSGQLKPSENDITLTEKIKKLGKLMDLEILDHLILTEDSFYSFADSGLM